jgi:hypothetical protein
MPRISISVAGDEWTNRDQVLDELSRCTESDHLFFEINTEGPSLHALGIVKDITAGISALNIDPSNVWIDKWHNSVETIPFNRVFTPRISHFFWLSDRYRHTVPLDLAQTHRAALFVGRLTKERAAIMYEINLSYPDQVLMSLMRNYDTSNVFSRSDFTEWIPKHRMEQFLAWWEFPSITSITGHAVRDQYRADKNTNADLAQHYNRFALEIVCETYCLGDAFFPTEKTVRPIAMMKPFLLYGPKKFLARLREMGFRTWHEFWDESYDEFEGADRWRRMQPALDQIMRHDLDLSGLAEICQHNKHRLDQLINQYRPG